MATHFRVRVDERTWQSDLSAASRAAQAAANAWRARVERHGLPAGELLACDPAHREFPLPGCVKSRLPDPASADVHRSPWGVVLQLAVDDDGPYLNYRAFGLRHPEASGSRRPSVYQVAAGRL